MIFQYSKERKFCNSTLTERIKVLEGLVKTQRGRQLLLRSERRTLEGSLLRLRLLRRRFSETDDRLRVSHRRLRASRLGIRPLRTEH